MTNNKLINKNTFKNILKNWQNWNTKDEFYDFRWKILFWKSGLNYISSDNCPGQSSNTHWKDDFVKLLNLVFSKFLKPFKNLFWIINKQKFVNQILKKFSFRCFSNFNYSLISVEKDNSSNRLFIQFVNFNTFYFQPKDQKSFHAFIKSLNYQF